MQLTPKSELDARINKFQDLLSGKNIDGVLIVQSVDLFYFSGTAQNAHLYIPAQGEPILMVRKSHSRARNESGLKNIVPLGSLKKMPEIISGAGYELPRTIGLEMDVVPAAQYLYYGQVFPGVEFVDVSGIIRRLRQKKSAYELDLLRTSGRKINNIYMEIPGMIKEGMTSIELASKFEGRARLDGHMGYVSLRAFNQSLFYGQLMSGKASAQPSFFDGPTGGQGLTPFYPQSAGFETISRGVPVLVDYTGIWDAYIVDLTRIYSIGPLPDKLAGAFETSLQIQAAILDRIEPGVNGSELHELALKMANDAGLAEHFMGFGPDQAKFIGHGVGLEVDELPVLAKGLDVTMEPGMVFALEPTFVFPELGAVGIENTFVLTENGVERITTTPDELVII